MTGPCLNGRYRGFSLLEVVLALVLLAIAFAFANKLFMSSMVVKRDALYAGRDLVRADSLVRLIRTDVWAAASVHSDRPDRCTLQMPDGTTVQWEHQLTWYGDEDEPESLIYRMETRDGIEVPGDPLFAPADLTFRVEGSDLVLSASDSAVRLTSMAQLIGEVQP